MDANILVETARISRYEWLMERKRGIGGSDASVVLGVNKFKSIYELYLEKTDLSFPESPMSESAEWGLKLEDLIAKEFEDRTYKKVTKIDAILQSKIFPFMLANIDRMLVDEDALLECKTASLHYEQEWVNGEIPAPYLAQVQHYMAVTGAKKAYIACLLGGQKFIINEINRDNEFIEMMIAMERDFWENNVLKLNPPAINGSLAVEEYFKKKYGTAEDKVIDLKSEYQDKVKDYLYLKSLKAIKDHELDDLEFKIREIENDIKNEMKEANIAILPKYIISWKNQETKRVNPDLLKTRFPDVYQKVLKITQSRKFLIKEA